MDADAVELRVIGCLIEKQRVTPDQYRLDARVAAVERVNLSLREVDLAVEVAV